MANPTDAEPYRLADSTSHLLHRAEQLANDRFAQLVGEEITLRQFSVLAAIAEAPGGSQNELVRATGIDRSTLADLVTRMEARGWIDRTTSLLDARAHSVRLASAGAGVLAAAAPHARAADAAILDLLPRTKRKAFQNTLAKLAKHSDEIAEMAAREARRAAKRQAREKQREKTEQKKKPKLKRAHGRKERG